MAATKTTFKIPKIAMQLGGKEVLAQIKYLGEGIFEESPLVPTLTYWGKFPEEASGDFTIVKTRDNGRIDITPFIEYSLKYEGISKLDLSDIDIKLLVDLENNNSKPDSEVVWTEIEPGWFNYNNNLTYGYRWEVEKEPEGGSFKYYLKTNVPNEGIRIISKENQPPVLPLGLTWKVMVTKKEHMTRQFDLLQLLNSVIADAVVTNTGTYTDKPISGKALYDYLKDQLVFSKLMVGESASNPGVINILLTGDSKDNYIKGSLKLYKNSQSEEAYVEIHDGKITLTDKDLIDLTNVDFKQAFNEYDFIPRRLLDIHEKSEITEELAVHGIKQGLKNGFNADRLDGIRVGKPGFDLKENLKLTENFIPYVDKDNSISLGSVTYSYSKDVEGNYVLAKTETIKPKSSEEVFNTDDFVTKIIKTNNTKFLSTIFNTKPLKLKVAKIVRTLSDGNNTELSTDDFEVNSNQLTLKEVKEVTELTKSTIYSNVLYYKYGSTYYDSEQDAEDSITDYDSSKLIVLKKEVVVKVNDDGTTTLYESGIDYTKSTVYPESLADLRDSNDITFLKTENDIDLLASVVAESFNIPSSENFKVDENGGKDFVEIPKNMLNLFSEIPYYTYQYEAERNVYGEDTKTKAGLIIERMNAAVESEHLDNKFIFSNEELKTTDEKNKYKFNYTDEEKEDLLKFSQLLLDGSTVNINSSVGLIMAALSEASKRLLRVESSIEGTDALYRPGEKEEHSGLAAGINQNPLDLGLNRVVRALAKEIFNDYNPLANTNSIFTDVSLSRIDRLDQQVNGEKAINTVDPDSATFILLNNALGKTYPSEINKSEENRKYYNSVEDYVVPQETLDGLEVYDSDKELLAGDLGKEFYDQPNYKIYVCVAEDDKYIYQEKQDPYYIKVQTFDELPEINEHLIPTLTNGKEYIASQGAWVIYSQVETEPLSEKDWDGLNDAVNRIAIKLNQITQDIYGSDNVNSNPQRLDTLRSNIETLIKDSYGKTYKDLDGEDSTPYVELSDKLNSKNDYIIDELWSTQVPFKSNYQNLNGRTFNGKPLKIDFSKLDQVTDDLQFVNPEFLETQEDLKEYASIIDVLVELIGQKSLVKFNKIESDNSRELNRLTQTLTDRILNLELALDSVSEKLIGEDFEQLKKDTKPQMEYLQESNQSDETVNKGLKEQLIDLETFCLRALEWIGITPVDAKKISWEATIDGNTLTTTEDKSVDYPQFIAHNDSTWIKDKVEGGLVKYLKYNDKWTNAPVTNWEGETSVENLIKEKRHIQSVIEYLFDSLRTNKTAVQALKNVLGTTRYNVDANTNVSTVEGDITNLYQVLFDSGVSAPTPIINIKTGPYQRIYQSLYRKGLKNIDSETFGDAKNPENPEDLILQNQNKYEYEDIILYLRNEISRLRKFIGFDKIDTEDGATGKYGFENSDYEFVFGYRKDDDEITTDSDMTCLLDYIKQFAGTVKIYEGIVSPEQSDIDFDWVN